MKRYALLCLCGVVLGGFVAALPAPLGYYSFTISGNAFSNAVTGELIQLPPAVSSRPDGVAGNCLELKPQNESYVSLGRKYGFSGDFSLSFWIRTAPGYNKGESVVLGRHQAYSSNGYYILLNAGWGAYGAPDKVTFYYTNATVISKSSVNDGRWHHVGVIYRAASGAELYMDGILEARGPVNPMVVPNVDFLLGSISYDRPYGSYGGMIDELALWDQALSAQDMAALASDPALIARQLSKGATPGDFFGGSTTTQAAQAGTLKIILRDGRSLSIPLADIERMEFGK